MAGEKTRWKPGQCPNPHGAATKLVKVRNDIIDKFNENRDAFLDALDAEIKQNPMKAYKEYLAPFMPRMTEVSGSEGSAIEVVIKRYDGAGNSAI